MDILTAALSGTRHPLAVGERIGVELDENPTTGYRWQPVVDADSLRVTDDGFTPAGDAVGASGTHRFVVTALREGATELRLRKLRSWVPEEVVDEFAVTLDVSRAPSR